MKRRLYHGLDICIYPNWLLILYCSFELLIEFCANTMLLWSQWVCRVYWRLVRHSSSLAGPRQLLHIDFPIYSLCLCPSVPSKPCWNCNFIYILIWEEFLPCVFKTISVSVVAQSCPALCNPMDCSNQAPPSMEFSRQEYWSGLPFPSPGDLPILGIEPGSPALQADSLLSEPQGKPTLRPWSSVLLSEVNFLF